MPLPYEAAFQGRTDLKSYGASGLLLFALELHFQLPDVQSVAANALTDGPDDKKCDLIYVDASTGVAVIAQSYISADLTRSEAPANKASDLNTAVAWVLTQPLPELPERIRSAASELRDALADRAIRSLEIWYVHNLPASRNVRRELEVVENAAKAAINTHFADSEVNDIRGLEVSREVLDEWYASLTVPILVSDTLDVAVPGCFEVAASDWSAVVTAVPASWLYDLFRQHGSRLFSANVRGYLGSRRSEANINHGIKRTAKDDPVHFWPFNNGITAIANGFEYLQDTHTLRLTGVSIVNGAQTTGAIGSLAVQPDADALVPARFVTCRNLDTVRGIIRCNNSQNVVEAPDFRSNDATQRRLVQEFAVIPNATYTGGRRGGIEDVIRRPANLIPTETAAQALAAFHQDPIIAYQEKSRIWQSDGIYSRFFSDRTTARHIVFCYSLLRAVEQKKWHLVTADQQDTLTEDGGRQLSFLRHRGATFLLVSAVARSLESIFARPLPDKFRLAFQARTSPAAAGSIWEPVVDATLPFCPYLTKAVENGLKNSELVREVLLQFQDMVQATRAANRAIYGTFEGSVEGIR